jgi:hypothetical protein
MILGEGEWGRVNGERRMTNDEGRSGVGKLSRMLQLVSRIVKALSAGIR